MKSVADESTNDGAGSDLMIADGRDEPAVGDGATAPTGRRRAVHALAAAMLGIVSIQTATATKSNDRQKSRSSGSVQSENKDKNKNKKGEKGNHGPDGPKSTTVRVIGDPSPLLGIVANDQVSSVVGCAPGQLLSCGWRYDVSPDTLVKTVTHVLSPDQTDLTFCQAFLSRTEPVGAPAGQIVAVAICRQ